MTGQQPQQREFIVKEPDLIEICRVLSFHGNPQLAKAFESVCRSRSIPISDKPRPPCEECIYQAQAAKARGDVLKELMRWMKEDCRLTFKLFSTGKML